MGIADGPQVQNIAPRQSGVPQGSSGVTVSLLFHQLPEKPQRGRCMPRI